MGIFNYIYNWMAQREIGKLFEMEWDPSKDIGFQRKMNDLGDRMKALQWIDINLPDARLQRETQ